MNETDIYRELAPPASLRGALACIWVRRGTEEPVRVMPDSCSDLIWRTGRDPIVAGPDTTHRLSETRPGEVVVGVRLLPGAGGPALGLPLEELRNQRVSLQDLGLDPYEQLHGAIDPSDALGRLMVVALALIRSGPPDRAVQAAVVRLRDPAQRVDRLARDIGLSERQLRRRFLTSVGYGPKTLQRVLRLRRFLASASTDLAIAAVDAGYADQPHLTRECKALTGLSPGQLLTSSSRAQAADRRALHGLAAECARAALIEREERGRQGPAEAHLALEP